MGPLAVDSIEQGTGPVVILVHSSVAGARQWRSMMDHLAGSYRLIAINLFGYGRTPAWDSDRRQTLEDQARLVAKALPEDGRDVCLVGHSFGGSVAMKAASLFPDRVRKLVLIEPNPFYILAQEGRNDAYREAAFLRDCIKEAGGNGDWSRAAATFADYWNGPGSWAAMPDERKARFAEALKPNYHEWDAVMTDDLSLEDWSRHLPNETTVVTAADTVNSIREIVSLLSEASPHWTFATLETGGHMAPLSRPDLVNPVIAEALA